MLFAESFDEFADWVVANSAVLIGGVVAIVVLSLICYFTRQRRLSEMERLAAAAAAAAESSAGPAASAEEKALQWDPPEHSYADRRGAVRREGTVVRVVLAAPTFRNGVGEGFVLDRSTGGLKITVATPLEPGMNMQVRAANAPESIGFVAVVVRSCRKSGEFYEIGCEFEKTPPWNVLLLFG
jgi:hypothetical protein